MSSPERARRAHGAASRRSVLTRSPGVVGINEGATPQQSQPFFCQIAGEPVAPGAGVVDEEQRGSLGWPLADEVLESTGAGANGAEAGDLGAVLWRHVRHGAGGFVDIQPDGACVRLRQG